MNRPNSSAPDGFPLSDAELSELRRTPTGRPPRHQPGERFLKGPIPWDWLMAAGRLPHQALQVALLLWREAGCEERATVRFRLADAAVFGASESTARRGVRALQAAGLVSVHHTPGRSLEVTLLRAPSATERVMDGDTVREVADDG